jgi:hypothetical protein
MRLREGLDQTPVASLRRMAELHGLDHGDAATHAELVEALVARLSDATYLHERLAELTPAERQALAAARRGGGEIRGFLLQRLLGSDEPGAVRALTEPGLLFRTFAPVGPHRGEVFTAADELLELLPPTDAEDDDVNPPLPVDPPERGARRGGDPAFSIFTLLSLRQRQVGAAPDASAGARASQLQSETERWTREPGGWAWPERWSFLEHLCVALGLIVDGRLASTARLARLLGDRGQLTGRLWQAYTRDRSWAELGRAGVPHGDELAEQADPTALRGSVLHELARLEPGRWLTVAELSGWLRRAAPTLVREHLDARAVVLRDPATGKPLFDDDGWALVEGPLLRYVVLGPLYWLGIVATDDAGERFALTPTGGALLRQSGEAPADRQAERCVWAGDAFEAPARADLGQLLRAEHYLHLEHRAQISRYRLQRGDIAAALLAGGSVDECRRLLLALGGPLPEAVESRLAQAEAEFGALVLRPAVLLEARSAAELDALDPALLRSRPGPTVAEVPAAQALAVAEELRRLGHLPRVDASLRLLAGRRAYQSLVDEQVLEFLLVSLLAFERARPEALAQLEGAPALAERLEGLFPDERLTQLRAAADHLAGRLTSEPPARRARRARRLGR